MISPSNRRAHIVGLGLIGGSLARALRARGWIVSGADIRDGVVQSALERGLIDAVTCAEPGAIAIIATPAGEVASIAHHLLERSEAWQAVSDVAGVKADIVDRVRHPGFVGGHPMAGSEAAGLDGARDDLFENCTWILTPSPQTSSTVFCAAFTVAVELGARVVSLDPVDHDRLVALVSHVPHVLAGSLVASLEEESSASPVIRELAAGGFRDMTRVAAGDPQIWPDVFLANAENLRSQLAIVRDHADALITAIDARDRSEIVRWLSRATRARSHLPTTFGLPVASHQVVVPTSSREGVVAEVAIGATLAGVTLVGVSVTTGSSSADEELRVLTDEEGAEKLAGRLRGRGLACSVGSA